MNYGQYFTNPRDILNPNIHSNVFYNRRGGSKYRNGEGQNRWTIDSSCSNFRDNNRQRSPYNENYRSRLTIPGYNNRRLRHANSKRRFPNTRNKTFCWGCGSPDHILSNRKCTSTLESIKTDIVGLPECDGDQTEIIADSSMLCMPVLRKKNSSKTAIRRCSIIVVYHMSTSKKLCTTSQKKRHWSLK